MNKYIVPEKRLNIFVKAAIITFICVCIASIVEQQFSYNSLCLEEEKLKQQVLERTEELEELEELLKYEFTDDYVKKIARRSLGYHMADEIIYYNNLSK